MRNSGNDSPEILAGLTEKVGKEDRPLPVPRSRMATTERIRNGMQALLALPYYLLVCPISQPGRTARFLQHIFEYQRSEKIYSRNRHLIPTVEPEQLFPGLFHQNISVLDLGSRPSGTTFRETYILVSLLKLLGARAIFEFGTSEGRTTLQFAINSPKDAEIFTLDLPADNFSTCFGRACPDEASFRRLPVGGLFEQYAECRKIRQFLADSATLNTEPFRDKMDLIFIDGDHSFNYLKSDSQNAFSMLSPRGVILWHDYGGRWPDVARFLRDLSSQKKLFHLAGTTLVVHDPAL